MSKKVFISYAAEDRDYAFRLLKDLEENGVEVFQFEASAKPGQPAWKQVLSYIAQCDCFVVLVSRSSVTSSAVSQEIDHAYQTRLNNNGKRPSLIPILLDNSEKPMELLTFTAIQGKKYQSALTDLLGTLDISLDKPRVPRQPIGLIKYLATVAGLAVVLIGAMVFAIYSITFEEHPGIQLALYGASAGCVGVLLSMLFRHPTIQCNWDDGRLTMVAQAVIRVVASGIGGGIMALAAWGVAWAISVTGIVGQLVPESHNSTGFGVFIAIVCLAGLIGGFVERWIPELYAPEEDAAAA